MRRAFLSLLILFTSFSISDEREDEIKQLEKSIQRLTTIRQLNIDYLAGLDADAESKRIKTTSNIHIAEKRIKEAEEKLKVLLTHP